MLLFLLPLIALLTLIAGAPLPAPTLASQQLDARQLKLLLNNPYVPTSTSCPAGGLNRPANGISSDESNYHSFRKTKTDHALATWLAKQGNFSTSSQPSIAFTASGGGYRAFLVAAGIIQTFDERDSDSGTSGLFQALTYMGGLSGGSWFLGSLAGNNWPTISSLRDKLWVPGFRSSLLLPANILEAGEDVKLAVDLVDKGLAGFDNTIVDAYGHLLAAQLLYGAGAGNNIHLSDLTTFSNFTGFDVPYPVMTAIGIPDPYEGVFAPTINSTQYEFHPYEYGSWDSGVAAFTRTQFMGSNLKSGTPAKDGECVKGYDDLGYILGTSSDIFPAFGPILDPLNSVLHPLLTMLQVLVKATPTPDFGLLFGVFPNPFYLSTDSGAVSEQPALAMIDGGSASQNVPIWPFIQPGRPVDVLIVSDASADTPDNFPTGVGMRQTYLSAQANGLTRMPYIPGNDTFVTQGLNKRATFFGCNSTDDTIFIIYLPNVPYTFPSGTFALQLQYPEDSTIGMIQNGNAIGTQAGDHGWPFCLACGLKHKDGEDLPQGCNACFEKYCYYEEGTTTGG